ncbi:MAG: CBS domain-containing protein [Rhodospirillaceae bacterium]|jgi:CBS domain-containing protein|nr:CBS domain-containing protein [Rhodospirillaceae bacterium]MBT4428862.1 CBS domain-containing protein [Rhodospirillaceae bacterium]MBT5038029.1 CBS domain-containing protein [Rhodospirillaceae bacterium]MBT5677389.1 CBS domain-containing protein [Rhodospirillaceae bacterium]MBT7293165.1 CBS domain-containing protein [Rhodospirillaceae bacterium]
MALEYTDYIVAQNATLLDAAEVIEHTHSRSAVVVEGEKVVGVISEGDILRALLRGVGVHAPLADFVNHSFKHLNAPDPVRALELFKHFGIAMVPVLDKEFRLIGVVTLHETLNAMELAPPKP